MTEAEIIEAIRAGIREPKARIAGPTGISLSIANAINIMGDILVRASPESFTILKSLQQVYGANRFSIPSDCEDILGVWDLGDNAIAITDATNASPIVITAASHGLEDDDVAIAHDVAGNTATNGTFLVDESDDDTLELYGSTGNGAYTSGGYIFKKSNDWVKLDRIPAHERSMDDDTHYFLDGDYIEVDDPEFENDLVILYRWKPDAIDEIIAKFHYGIVAFGIIEQINLPEDKDPNYQDLKKSLDWSMVQWERCQADMKDYKPVAEKPKMSERASGVKGFI